MCKAFRNRHTFIHAFNRADEFYGFIRFADAFNADEVGKLRKAFINGAAVFFQNDRQNHGVGKTVRNAVHTAEVVCNRMDIADIGSCERHARIERSEQHIVSCLDVFPVVIGSFKVIKNQFCRFFGILEGGLHIALADISFDRVGQRVETCGRGDFRRKTDGKFGVKHRKFRAQAGVVNRIFFVCLRVGNDRGKRGFRAGARRCGNGEERRKFVHNFHNAAHLRNGFVRTNDSCGRRFGAVHRAAAAERNHRFAAVGNEHFARLFDVFNRGVGLNAVIDDILNIFCFQFFKKAVQKMQAHQAFIGDDHHVVNPFVGNHAGQFFDAAGTGQKLRLRPIEENHKDFHDFLKCTVISCFQSPHNLHHPYGNFW